jgi:hypothetical protein
VNGALHDGLDAFDATVLEIWRNEYAPSSKSAVTASKITKPTFSVVQGRPAKGTMTNSDYDESAAFPFRGRRLADAHIYQN